MNCRSYFSFCVESIHHMKCKIRHVFCSSDFWECVCGMFVFCESVSTFCVCLNLCTHVCVHMYKYPCLCVCLHLLMYLGSGICLYVSTYACTHVHTYVCMYACMQVCMRLNSRTYTPGGPKNVLKILQALAHQISAMSQVIWSHDYTCACYVHSDTFLTCCKSIVV